MSTTEMVVRDRTVALAESMGIDPQSVNTADWRTFCDIARVTVPVSDEYFDLVVGANLDWQADQYRYHTGKVHEHSSHEVRAAVIRTVARFQHGVEAFEQAVNR